MVRMSLSRKIIIARMHNFGVQSIVHFWDHEGPYSLEALYHSCGVELHIRLHMFDRTMLPVRSAHEETPYQLRLFQVQQRISWTHSGHKSRGRLPSQKANSLPIS